MALAELGAPVEFVVRVDPLREAAEIEGEIEEGAVSSPVEVVGRLAREGGDEGAARGVLRGQRGQHRAASHPTGPRAQALGDVDARCQLRVVPGRPFPSRAKPFPPDIPDEPDGPLRGVAQRDQDGDAPPAGREASQERGIHAALMTVAALELAILRVLAAARGDARPGGPAAAREVRADLKLLGPFEEAPRHEGAAFGVSGIHRRRGEVGRRRQRHPVPRLEVEHGVLLAQVHSGEACVGRVEAGGDEAIVPSGPGREGRVVDDAALAAPNVELAHEQVVPRVNPVGDLERRPAWSAFEAGAEERSILRDVGAVGAPARILRPQEAVPRRPETSARAQPGVRFVGAAVLAMLGRGSVVLHPRQPQHTRGRHEPIAQHAAPRVQDMPGEVPELVAVRQKRPAQEDQLAPGRDARGEAAIAERARHVRRAARHLREEVRQQERVAQNAAPRGPHPTTLCRGAASYAKTGDGS